MQNRTCGYRVAGSVLLLLLLGLSGCANRVVTITLDSSPQGAKGYRDGVFLDQLPITFDYPFKPEQVARGYVTTKPTTIRWLSGAEYFSSGVTVYLKNGPNQYFCFKRPVGVSGEATDINYAMTAASIAARRQAATTQPWPTNFPSTVYPQNAALANSVAVSGYYRKNGTYVQPFYRSQADGIKINNWSTHGNINPYTGRLGTRRGY